MIWFSFDAKLATKKTILPFTSNGTWESIHWTADPLTDVSKNDMVDLRIWTVFTQISKIGIGPLSSD